MSFTQKLWTTYHGYADGDTRIGEKNRIWYSSASNTLRIQLDNTPGGTVIGSGAGGFIHFGDLSVTTNSATGGGTLSYNGNNGVFTFRPADLSTFATTTYVNNQITAVKDRIVSPNNSYTTVIDNTGTTTVAGNLVPNITTSTLGTIANPWKDIYVSQGSIVIANLDPALDGVSISNTDKYIVIDRGGLKVTANDGTHEIFQLENTGKLLIKSEIPLVTDSAAFEVIGSLLGASLPIVNRGVMIHSSGAVNVPSRVYVDGVGTQTTAPYDSAYAAFIGRYARNTVADPQPAQAGDIIVRFGGNAMADGLGLNTISNVRIDMTATETQSAEGRGSRIELWTTPIGSVVPQRSLHVDSGGIDLSEATDTNAGVTFKDGSLLKYWPSVSGNNGKILRTNGTDFFWANETVVAGQVIFKGDWSAANPPGGGTPTLSDATGQAGWQYIVNAAGTQNLGSGNITFAVGDLVIHDGTRYVKIDGTTPQVQADWTETNSALPAYIKHKPNLATVATSGSYFDLPDRPSIPAAQVNSDWDATSGLAQILHKPNIPTQYTDTLARAAITLTSNTPTGTVSTLTYTSGVFTFTSAAALVSGTTIKTVNSNSLLGSGDIAVGTVTNVSGTGSVNGLSLSGSVSVSGSLTLSGTLSGITNSNLSGTAGITNANLATPTISGVQLGNNLATLTISGPLTGTSYNGSSAVSIGIPQATSSVSGYLTSTDWTTFNNKTSNTGTVTSVATAGTVSGLTLTGGTITTSGTITLGGSISGLTNSNLSGTAGITNANLANSSVTVTAGTGMSGGGSVSLGGTVTLTNAGVTALTTSSGLSTNTSATGAVSITNTGVTSIVAGTNITVSGATGAVTVNANIGVGGNQLVYVLDAVLSLASAKNTLASIFGLTSGVTVTSNTRYQYELVFNLQASKTGVLSYALALGGSAAVAQHNYSFEGNTTTTISGYIAGVSLMSANATGAAITTAQTVADTLNGFAHYIVCGTIDVTTGGTVNFMISQDQNTPITWSVKAGAYIKLTPLGAIGANTAAGTWA
jgi:hypothetical protein